MEVTQDLCHILSLDVSHNFHLYSGEVTVESEAHRGSAQGLYMTQHSLLTSGSSISLKYTKYLPNQYFLSFRWETVWSQVSIPCCCVGDTFSKESSQPGILRLETSHVISYWYLPLRPCQYILYCSNFTA